jgi:hypothetical protein
MKRRIPLSIALIFYLALSMLLAHLWQRHPLELSATVLAKLKKTKIILVSNLINAEVPLRMGMYDAIVGLTQHEALRGNIFVSLYENGSDDGTKEILNRLDAELESLGVAPRRIWVDSTRESLREKYAKLPKDKDGKPQIALAPERSAYVANLRNVALEPLVQRHKNAEYDKFFTLKSDERLIVLFINDVIVTE